MAFAMTFFIPNLCECLTAETFFAQLSMMFKEESLNNYSNNFLQLQHNFILARDGMKCLNEQKHPP